MSATYRYDELFSNHTNKADHIVQDEATHSGTYPDTQDDGRRPLGQVLA